MKKSELVHTYSIIAMDRKNGEMGGAVQSHYFSVGGTVIWAEAGTGVVATQAMVNIDYGSQGLSLLREGRAAEEVLARLTEGDEGSAFRQAAVLDCRGGVEAFTGDKTIRESGHVVGDGFSCQANMMLKDTVPGAMVKAFDTATGCLADRLMAALEAAEGEGGDIRGRQSASLTIVSLKDCGNVRDNMKVDLRVEDHPEPLIEMRRLLNIHNAYTHADLGDLAVEQGNFSQAMIEYGLAEKLLPDNGELRFWKAVSLLNNNRISEADPIFRNIIQQDYRWRELLLRLPAAEVVREDASILSYLQSLTEG